jgi:hypothetical protein
MKSIEVGVKGKWQFGDLLCGESRQFLEAGTGNTVTECLPSM